MNGLYNNLKTQRKSGQGDEKIIQEDLHFFFERKRERHSSRTSVGNCLFLVQGRKNTNKILYYEKKDNIKKT